MLIIQSCTTIMKPFAGSSKYDPEEIDQLSEGAKLLLERSKLADGVYGHDYHMHLVGNGRQYGTYVHPKKFKFWNLKEYLVLQSIRSASRVEDLEKVDVQYLARLIALIKYNPIKVKHQLLAFDHYYHEDGTKDLDKSEFYISNERVVELAKEFPDYFDATISVHPYRKDAIKELEKWGKQGIRFIKWLPNAHGMDPMSPLCDEYYKTMKKYNMVIISHVGAERTVSDEHQHLANPLRFRRPLDMGVKIVMAHCASLGDNKDIDDPDSSEPVSNFDLFMRLMKEKKYEGLLFADISATTFSNRIPKAITHILADKSIHHRLLNASDYPIPAINVVIQLGALVRHGLITEGERKYLKEIFNYNPLLFSFVLKRTLKTPGTNEGFPESVFMENKDL